MKALVHAVSVACLAALCSALAPQIAQAQNKELRYSLYLPPRSVEGTVVPPFLEELGKRTNGRVTGRLFPGGQLFSGPATLKGIRDGGADMGFIVLPLTLGELKHANIGVDLQLHTTDPFVAVIYRVQMESGVGPLVEAMRSRTTVFVRDTATEQRWPEWAAQVLAPIIRGTARRTIPRPSFPCR